MLIPAGTSPRLVGIVLWGSLCLICFAIALVRGSVSFAIFGVMVLVLALDDLLEPRP